LIASAPSRRAKISITIMPVAGWRDCTRRHAANLQLDKPKQRYCNFQTRRGRVSRPARQRHFDEQVIFQPGEPGYAGVAMPADFPTEHCQCRSFVFLTL